MVKRWIWSGDRYHATGSVVVVVLLGEEGEEITRKTVTVDPGTTQLELSFSVHYNAIIRQVQVICPGAGWVHRYALNVLSTGDLTITIELGST